VTTDPLDDPRPAGGASDPPPIVRWWRVYAVVIALVVIQLAL